MCQTFWRHKILIYLHVNIVKHMHHTITKYRLFLLQKACLHFIIFTFLFHLIKMFVKIETMEGPLLIVLILFWSAYKHGCHRQFFFLVGLTGEQHRLSWAQPTDPLDLFWHIMHIWRCYIVSNVGQFKKSYLH